MKQVFKLVILLHVFLCGLFAQDSSNINGYKKFYYPNGSLQSEGTIVNGKPDGFWINYYPTGVKKSEGSRRNYKLDSVWVFYSISGDTISKVSYIEGKRNGYSYVYFHNEENPEKRGIIKSKVLYLNNKKEGKEYFYYRNGMLKEEYEYIGNKKNGHGYTYEKDGRVVNEYIYRKGEIKERQKINRYNSEEKKDGKWVEYYSNKKVRKEYNFSDGLLNGYSKEYSESGKLLFTYLYRNGKLIESFDDSNYKAKKKVTFSKDSMVVKEGMYRNDKPIGIHKKYHKKDGKIIATIYNDSSMITESGEMDSNGYRNGEWKEFYTNGNIRASGKYVKNKKSGTWEYLYKNGVREQIGDYLNGKLNGEWRWYYSNGSLWKVEEYYNNREEGMYTEYDLVENIIVEGEYFDGEKEGVWKTIINDHKATGSYEAGFMNGRWKHFYENGVLSFEGNYIQGNADGKHRYYYSNGSLKEEQFYSMGVRQKHWKKFNEFGQLLITISYKDDIEYRINGMKIEFDLNMPKILY